MNTNKYDTISRTKFDEKKGFQFLESLVINVIATGFEPVTV